MEIQDLKKLYYGRLKLSKNKILEFQKQGIIITKKGIYEIRTIECDASICKILNGVIKEDGLCDIMEKIYPKQKSLILSRRE